MKKMIGWTAGVLALAAVSQASAMDMDSVRRHDKPDIASAQAAEVCAASTMGAAYLAADGSDEKTLNTTLAKGWVALAVKATGHDANDYIDNVLISNMQALYDAGDDTVKFYHDYCLVLSKQLLDG
ncbi:MAG: hypothetical protein JF615_04565 [Asticcacaulis sp.]|nr:hypothetical protein [Asticcacaulis sp.]